MQNAPERMNDKGTCSPTDTPLAHAGSRPVRYRLIFPDGRRSAPFTPKPGEFANILAAAIPGQGDYELEWV